MNIIKLNAKNINKVLKEAGRVLKGGGIIAYPTETFYGLGAKYDMEEALRRLRALKGRRRAKAMPLVAGDMNSLEKVVSGFNEVEKSLMGGFWPGPLTILFRAKKGLSRHVSSKGKVAVRIPSGEVAIRLAKALRHPLTATSANPSGKPPARSAWMVARYFDGGIDLIIDGGHTPGGKPSTIIDASGRKLRLVRVGAVSYKKILMHLKTS